MILREEVKKYVGAPFSGAAERMIAVCVLGASVCIALPADAQVTGATLSGVLTESSGGAIPNAQVEIKNLATGVTTNLVSNGEGFYTAPNLQPGGYRLTAKAPGFTTEVRNGITLEVGGHQVLNVSLPVGGVTESVQVEATAPDIDLASSIVGAVVGHDAVVDLPLNGRSWVDLAALEPGTSALSNQTPFDNLSDARARAGKAYGSQDTIHGGRPSTNNYRLDGLSILDYANSPASNASGETTGVEAVQEFSVQTASLSAEYGKTAGGVVNAITRSGTNQFHGSLYDFARNSQLDARNYFDGTTIPPFRRNQFGGSVGGPIFKDRTFFFANYEGLRQLKALTIQNVVPSQAARNGSLCSRPDLVAAGAPCTGSTITVDPAATAYLQFFPLPNAALVSTGHGDTGIYNFAASQIANYNLFTAKIDHVISTKDHIGGTFLIDRGPFTTPDNFNDVVLGFTNNLQTYEVDETHTFNSNFVNTARAGVFHQFATASQFLGAPNPLVTSTSLGYASGLTAAQVKIGGLATFAGGSTAYGTQSWNYTTYQIYDDASLVKGNHTFKFGFSGEQQIYKYLSIPLGGVWTFGNLTGFLTNAPTAFQTQPTVNTTDSWSLHDNIIAGYGQDDWRIRKNLTLNLGIRYEMLTNPTSAHGYWAALQNITDASPRLGSPIIPNNPTLRDFEPRIGFVYDPFKDGKSSIRGGFAIYDVLPMEYLFFRALSGAAPSQSIYTINNAAALKGTFYNKVPTSLFVASAQTVDYVPNLNRSYVEQWNFSVQRELAPSLTMTVSYVGSHGVHLPMKAVDLNTNVPVSTQYGYVYPVTANKLNKNWGQVQGSYSSIANSTFNDLEVRLNKRLSHNFQIQGSYTWSKSLDNASSNLSSQDFTNSLNNYPVFNPGLARGLSDFNVGQNAVINAIYKVPEFKAAHGLAGIVANGWQLSTIYQASTGNPFTPTWGTGSNGTLAGTLSSATPGFLTRVKTTGCETGTNTRNVANFIKTSCFTIPQAPNPGFYTQYCNPAYAYPTCSNLRGAEGRNSLIGPGIQNVNASIFKNNKFGDRYDVQLRAEFFNIFNHTNLSPPSLTNNDVFTSTGAVSSTAGLLTYTSTSSRQVQLAVKLMF